uniref:Putative secreted protein n=1 Tax=Panstrongylus lignarius TaxID=156445 RepID=A0A224Y6L1_9HEMI
MPKSPLWNLILIIMVVKAFEVISKPLSKNNRDGTSILLGTKFEFVTKLLSHFIEHPSYLIFKFIYTTII